MNQFGYETQSKPQTNQKTLWIKKLKRKEVKLIWKFHRLKKNIENAIRSRMMMMMMTENQHGQEYDSFTYILIRMHSF
ncbi:hypothetical protein Syun_012784 [Stephania yunnanensis]|uniref:Uncharacterized protein n=1 Tax=Stephania yunnanensis TaxID=152371 RepID=A0AAP0K0W3_9MAGN